MNVLTVLGVLFSGVLLAPPQEPGAAAPAEHQTAEKVERLTIPAEERASKKRYGIYVEFYEASPDRTTPLLMLLHQSRSSRGEYRPIAPRLKALGYNCMLVDLCVGKVAREVKNQTAKMASGGGLDPTYLDALVDIEDALIWARENRAHGPLVVWGSSYSASLALYLAAAQPRYVDGVVSFSPGEYFASLGKGETWIRDSAKGVQCPVFLTSTRAEEADWKPIFDALPGANKTCFVPEGAGTHGSSALWEETAGHEEYWQAVEAFLKQHFPATPRNAAAPETPK